MRPRWCQFRSIDPYTHVCEICRRPATTTNPHPRIRRECPGRPVADDRQAIPAPPAPRVSDAEIDELRQALAGRHAAGLAEVSWHETERRLAICRPCRHLAPAGDSIEIHCDRCRGCAGDRGHKLRLALTTDERSCPLGLFDEETLEVQPIKTRNLIYHVYASQANDLWRMNVRQLVRRWHVFNGRKVIAIATGAGIHTPDVVRGEFGHPPGVEWLKVPNDARLREVATFLPLLEAIQSTSADEASFYAHTKGNSTADDAQGAMRWRNMMYARLLDQVATVMECLRVAPCVGTTKIIWRKGDRIPYPTQLRHGRWMFAGTFFWFRNDRVFSHPRWRDVPQDRYGAEAWLSGLFQDHEGISLCQPWPAHEYPTPNPYTPALYNWRYDDPQETT